MTVNPRLPRARRVPRQIEVEVMGGNARQTRTGIDPDHAVRAKAAVLVRGRRRQCGLTADQLGRRNRVLIEVRAAVVRADGIERRAERRIDIRVTGREVEATRGTGELDFRALPARLADRVEVARGRLRLPAKPEVVAKVRATTR